MKKIILLIAVLALLASCRSPEKMCNKAQLKYERVAYRWGCPLVIQSDTVYNQMIIRETRDTTIYIRIAPDTVHSVDTVTIINGLPESDKSRLDTQYAFSIAYVHGSKLYHNLFQKETEIAATIKAAIQSNSKVEYKYIKKIVKENYVTGWQWFQIYAFWGLLLLVGVFFIFRLLFK